MPAMIKDPNPLAIRVGGRIRDLRKAQGMKQETLAQEVGYGSRSAIASIETGFVLPSFDKAVDIARVLGVHPGTLFDDPDLEASQKQPSQDHALLLALGHMARHCSPEQRKLLAGYVRIFADALEAH